MNLVNILDKFELVYLDLLFNVRGQVLENNVTMTSGKSCRILELIL